MSERTYWHVPAARSWHAQKPGAIKGRVAAQTDIGPLAMPGVAEAVRG